MHIRKHGTGYRVIVQYKGQRADAVAATKSEAEQQGARLLIELGGRLTPRSTTVAVMIAEWRASCSHSPTYAADIGRVIDKLPDSFTGRTIDSVDPAVIAQLYRSLTVAGWSPHRVKRCHDVLRASWQLAIQYQWAATNPAAVIVPPTRPPHEIVPPAASDVGRLLEGVKGTTFELYLLLAATTGARSGELCALQWEDIEGETVKIRRSVVWTPASGLVVRGTKTGIKGHRVIAVSPDVAARLATLRLSQRTKAMAAGLSGHPIWVFSHDAGRSPWLPNYPTHVFVKLRKRLGISGVRLHDLRHFMATQLLAAGLAPVTVSHRLGHSTTATMHRTYAHYVLATDQNAAGTMDRILASRGGA